MRLLQMKLKAFVVLILLPLVASKTKEVVRDKGISFASLNDTNLSIEEIQDIMEFLSMFSDLSSRILAMVSSFQEKLNSLSINKCATDMNILLDDIKKTENWTLNLLDAWAKPSLTLGWIGSTSICRKAQTNYTSLSDTHQFQGQLCDLLISLPQEMFFNMSVKFGMCLPDSCSEDVIHDILVDVNANRPNWKYMPWFNIRCNYNISRYMDINFILISIILAILIVFIIIGTILDVLIHRYDQNKLHKCKARIDTLKSRNSCYVVLAENDHKNDYKINQIIKRNKISDDNENNSKEFSEAILRNGEDKLEPLYYGFKDTLLGKVILCFSVYTNGARLVLCKQQDQQLACINGFRVLSMLGVMTAHSYNIIGAADNPTNILTIMQTFKFNNLLMASFTMSTFFTMSGVLVSYLYFTLQKTGVKVSWFQFYFDRYLRISPAFMFSVLLLWGFFPKILRGQLDFAMEYVGRICETSWWWNLLYLQNMLSNAEICYGISWYLATDMQLYWLSPIFLILLKKSFSLTLVISVLYIMSTWIATTALTFTYHYQLLLPKVIDPYLTLNLLFSKEWFQAIYTRTWFRLNAYLLGMLCGWALYKTNCSIKLSKGQASKLWMLSLSFTLPVMFILYFFQLSEEMTAVYFVLYGTIWPLGFSIAIFLCSSGHGGIINSIMSWSGWLPFSRLSFALYLTHFLVLQYSTINIEKFVHLTYGSIMMNLCSMWQLSVIAAAFLYLMIEVPSLRLKNVFLKKK